MKKEKVNPSVSNDNRHRQLSKKNLQRQLIRVATSCFFLCSGYLLPAIQAMAIEDTVTAQESSSQAEENFEPSTKIPESSTFIEFSEDTPQQTKETVLLLPKAEMDETKAQEVLKNLEQDIAGLQPVTTSKAIPLSTLSKPIVRSSTTSAKKYPPTGMLQGTGMVIAGLVIIVAAIVGWKRKK
ncbi:hypothetical protein [Enterococcus sp. AZ196]|uniref:hypothetical protein n=1 Tax=Enterococcus sp. AZ196 TaxID=2774659 RepID=UPI003D2CC487